MSETDTPDAPVTPAPAAPAAAPATETPADAAPKKPARRTSRTRVKKAAEEAPADAAPAEEAPRAPRKRAAKAAKPADEPADSAPRESAERAPEPAAEAPAEGEAPKKPRRSVKSKTAGEAAADAPADDDARPGRHSSAVRAKRRSVRSQNGEGAKDRASQKDRPAQKDHGSQKDHGAQKDRDQQNRSRNGKNNQKQSASQNNGNRRHGRNKQHANREVTPDVSVEELSKLKVAELREKAAELELDVKGLKKAELVQAVYEGTMKKEGFIDVSGVLDILSDGYGFLRTEGYLPSENDVYVGLSTIRRNGMRKGDFVAGQVRPARSNEKYAALHKVYTINGLDPEAAKLRPHFRELTPVYPDERLVMEHGRSTITSRVIDLAAPIGKGQRGLIVSPPKAGKTTVLKQIAASISANNPECHLMCLLVDERPEEVTDMQRSIKGEVISSTFDMPSENHIAAAEMVIERAKRLVEMGQDVVILLDSITRLARAYNLAQPASGRILSGGVDSTALYPPKKFFGAARNIEHGGSLTILASALIDTGSKMDEVIFEEFKGTGNMELRLDRNLADRRIYPAIDPVASSTRKEDLLLDPQEAPLIWAVRRILANMNNSERAMDMLIKSLKQTETNREFLLRTAKKAQSRRMDENFEL